MGVRSLGGVVFHTVSHNQFDTYVICSGAVHKWSKGVSAIVGQVFHFEFSHARIKIAVHVGSVGVMISKLVIDQVLQRVCNICYLYGC